MAAYPRFETAPGGAQVAVGLARVIGRTSRLWKQRGLGSIYKMLRRAPVVGRARCVVELSRGTYFETDVFEPYWAPTIIGGRPYEPELMYLLERVGSLKPVLVDAGANFGYWSVLATSAEIGFAGAVAIEASPNTSRFLRANARLNGDRFHVLNRAVSAKSGETVRLAESDGHAVAHVNASGSGADVETISLDDAVREAGLWDRERFVLKIDVEGLELAAFEGSRELRNSKDHVVFVEDFPDTGAGGFENVAALLDEGYVVSYVGADGRCESIRSVAHVFEAMKKHPNAGRSRNFVATKPTGAFFDVIDRWAKER